MLWCCYLIEFLLFRVYSSVCHSFAFAFGWSAPSGTNRRADGSSVQAKACALILAHPFRSDDVALHPLLFLMYCFMCLYVCLCRPFQPLTEAVVSASSAGTPFRLLLDTLALMRALHSLSHWGICIGSFPKFGSFRKVCVTLLWSVLLFHRTQG